MHLMPHVVAATYFFFFHVLGPLLTQFVCPHFFSSCFLSSSFHVLCFYIYPSSLPFDLSPHTFLNLLKTWKAAPPSPPPLRTPHPHKQQQHLTHSRCQQQRQPLQPSQAHPPICRSQPPSSPLVPSPILLQPTLPLILTPLVMMIFNVPRLRAPSLMPLLLVLLRAVADAPALLLLLQLQKRGRA